MSRSFDGSNDNAIGAFASTYGGPITLGCWFKFTDHPVAIDVLVQVGESNSSSDESYVLRTTSTDNQFTAYVQGSGGSGIANVSKSGIDGVWTPFLGVYIAADDRDSYVGDAVGGSLVAASFPDAVQHVRLGENMGAGQDYTGLLAEVCVWNKELDAGEIAAFLAGDSPLSIAGANLVGYWPMSANGGSSEANLGVDTGGDLTFSGPVFDADHPTISGGGSSIAAKVRFYNMLRNAS